MSRDGRLGKRAEREGFTAAQDLARALGLECTHQRSGKHLMAVITLKDGATVRVPISGSPGQGQGGSAFLTRVTLRRRLRRRGIEGAAI